jgi:peptidoglycan biosynthesis protein MviN/MurJ (putative lipid II flippase)
MSKAMIVGMLSCGVGVILTFVLGAVLAGRSKSIDEFWLFGATSMLPWLSFLLGFRPLAKREGKWPIPTRGPRLLAALIVALCSSVAAYLCIAVMSFTWNVGSLPPEKQSFTYIVCHPSEIPPLRQRTEYFDRQRRATEHNVTWPAPTIGAFILGGFLGFVWFGRWDKV